MPTVYEGNFATPAGRFALVAARFNGAVVDGLLAGALDGLRRHGVADEAIEVVRVPGSFEIPLVAKRLAGSGRYAAVICLGAIIRGKSGQLISMRLSSARLDTTKLSRWRILFLQSRSSTIASDRVPTRFLRDWRPNLFFLLSRRSSMRG